MAIRVIVFAIAPLFYTISIAIAIPGSIISSRLFVAKPISYGRRLAWELKRLKQSETPDWEGKALKLIRRSRLENPQDEFRRLRAEGILTPERERRLNRSLDKVIKEQDYDNSIIESSKMLIAQALEIREMFKETHDVFIHAQATSWVILTYLIKELVKKFKPDLDVKHFKFLRSPSAQVLPLKLYSTNRPREAMLSERDKNIKNHIKAHGRMSDDKKEVSDKYLSVDGWYYNYHKWESSSYFLVNNSNIKGNEDFIKGVIEEVLVRCFPKAKREDLEDYSDRIFESGFKKMACGNLFVLPFLKENSRRSQVRSHPFNEECACHPAGQTKDREIIDKLMNDIFDDTIKCTKAVDVGGYRVKAPQFRAFAPALEPGNGNKNVLLTPYAKKQRKAVKGRIKNIINEMDKRYNLAGG